MVSETQKSDAGSTSHIQDVAGVLCALGADASSGLSTAEAGTRLDRNGPNEFIETSGRGPWLIIYEQLSSAMVMLLFVAGGGKICRLRTDTLEELESLGEKELKGTAVSGLAVMPASE